jgi:AcrR family transcriptional regulator
VQYFKSSALVSEQPSVTLQSMKLEPQSLVGARARARAEVRAEILAAASRQLALEGASALSLRAVARELGMVSSALYRYFASRDDLLTALIIEAYDSLGERAERAAASSVGTPPLERWVEVATTIRSWAVERPHDYALIYGSPVPGYAAPTDTVVPGTRVTRALVSIVHDASAQRLLPRRRPSSEVEISDATRSACAFLRAELDLAINDDAIIAVLLAWTQLFGLLSFELFGQTKGLVTDHDAFFHESATLMGARIGLPH